ncbi:hypothetical protein EMMF5_006617 [Cystobasidiomycetes sp. EMM_F5]
MAAELIAFTLSPSGNSWLAIAQINHAARCPHPALKCIAPWEAATDFYRDFTMRGGMGLTPAFTHLLMGGTAGEKNSYPLNVLEHIV